MTPTQALDNKCFSFHDLPQKALNSHKQPTATLPHGVPHNHLHDKALRR